MVILSKADYQKVFFMSIDAATSTFTRHNMRKPSTRRIISTPKALIGRVRHDLKQSAASWPLIIKEHARSHR